jgi:acylphosphatase
LGVRGWVRNCSDGSVEAQLEGDSERVDQLVGLLREGPPGARVDHVQIEDADAQGLKTFEVRN